MAGKKRNRELDDDTEVQLKSEKGGSVLISDAADLTIHSHNTLFSYCCGTTDQEIYITEAVISSGGVRFKADINYTLFNQGKNDYEASISTLTIVNAHNPVGYAMIVHIGDKARLGLVRAISNSEVSRLRGVLHNKSTPHQSAVA